MRVVLLASLLFFSVLAVGQPAHIEGTLPASYAGKTVRLTLMNYETRKDSVLQETKPNAKGGFYFVIPLKEPRIYSVGISDSVMLQVLARPKANIHLQIGRDTIVSSGSPETGYLIAYESARKRIFSKYLRRTYDSSAAAVSSGDSARIEYWNVEHEKASEAYKAELSAWAKQPFFLQSLAAVHHSIRWHSDNDIALMDEMLSVYLKKYPGLTLTRQLQHRVDATRRIAIGATAPEFATGDTTGNKVSLTSFRGKYTLIEFWASWCAPCREESPTLVRLYNSYRNNNFTIVSVSIDNDKRRWISAINKDGYTWPNVCDLEGYAGPTAARYTVTAIPNSFLLDTNGKIIAKNLRGTKLEEKLAELFGK